MRQTIRVNEYYDLFDIKTIAGITTEAMTNIPTTIKNTNKTNPFRGFWNFPDYNTAQKPLDLIQVTGQQKSSQANSSIRIDENGDIWCYPPNVSVPYWSKIIFRNFDYSYKSVPIGEIAGPLDEIAAVPFTYTFPMTTYYNIPPTNYLPVPEYLWNQDNTDGSLDNRDWTKNDYTDLSGAQFSGMNYNFEHCPLFLRFDEYPSRSKVIFSNCDKTRNPDIEFRFDYKKGQIEPIKLNLSLSANIPVKDPTTPSNVYNQNLTKAEINNVLNVCYWCIEWIYEPDTK